jgi:hypothetical protein
VGHVVLDVVELHLELRLANAERFRKNRLEVSDFLDAPQPIQTLLGEHESVEEDEGDLVDQMRARNSRDAHMRNLRDSNAGLAQTMAHREGREAGGMLDAIESLLLYGCDDFPVSQENRGRIAMIGIDTQDVMIRNTHSLTSLDEIKEWMIAKPRR